MNITPDYFQSPSDTDTLERLRLRLERAAEAEGLLDVAYTTVDSPVGPLLLAATPKGLVRVAYDTEDHDRVLDTLSQRLSPRVLKAPKRLDAAARELEEYFGGRRQVFDLPLDRLRVREGEVPVLALAEPVPAHVDRAAEAPGLVIQPADLRRLLRGEQLGQQRPAVRIQLSPDRVPVA